MAYKGMAGMGMAYIVMAYIVIACIVMAYIAMAYADVPHRLRELRHHEALAARVAGRAWVPPFFI